MSLRRPVAAAAIVAVLLGACGGDDSSDPAETGEAPTTTTTEAPSTETTGEATSSTTSTTAQAIAGDPVAAGEAFLEAAFPGSAATVGEFQQGDSQSGELPVFRPGEGGPSDRLATTLLLRLGPADAWEVIGAVNEFVTIDEPENGAEVAAGPVEVTGSARGFEATVNAFAAGADGTPIGDVVLAEGGGAFETPEPYTATVDLSTVTAGEQAYIVVHGGTGLDGDTGEFSAIRVTVG